MSARIAPQTCTSHHLYLFGVTNEEDAKRMREIQEVLAADEEANIRKLDSMKAFLSALLFLDSYATYDEIVENQRKLALSLLPYLPNHINDTLHTAALLARLAGKPTASTTAGLQHTFYTKPPIFTDKGSFSWSSLVMAWWGNTVAPLLVEFEDRESVCTYEFPSLSVPSDSVTFAEYFVQTAIEALELPMTTEIRGILKAEFSERPELLRDLTYFVHNRGAEDLPEEIAPLIAKLRAFQALGRPDSAELLTFIFSCDALPPIPEDLTGLDRAIVLVPCFQTLYAEAYSPHALELCLAITSNPSGPLVFQLLQSIAQCEMFKTNHEQILRMLGIPITTI